MRELNYAKVLLTSLMNLISLEKIFLRDQTFVENLVAISSEAIKADIAKRLLKCK